MARPRQFSTEDILAAARECIFEHGPGVSTRVIADKVGLSQAALFKRFGTKEDLLTAALRPPEVLPWLTRVEAGPDERDLRRQLVEIAALASEFFDMLMPRVVALKFSGVDPRDLFDSHPEPPPVRARRVLSEWFQRAIDQGRMRVVDPDAAAFAFLGALHLRPFLFHGFGIQAGPTDRTQFAESVVDTLWSGIATSLVAEEAS